MQNKETLFDFIKEQSRILFILLAAVLIFSVVLTAADRGFDQAASFMPYWKTYLLNFVYSLVAVASMAVAYRYADDLFDWKILQFLCDREYADAYIYTLMLTMLVCVLYVVKSLLVFATGMEFSHVQTTITLNVAIIIAPPVLFFTGFALIANWGRIVATFNVGIYKTVGAFLMLGFMQNDVISEEYDKYHYLSDNLVESDNYEIQKLINGKIDRNIFFDRVNKTFLISRRLFNSNEYDFFKINEKGYVIDSLAFSSRLYTSGMYFEEEYYIDWVVTGNKSRQKYFKIINADNLTEEAFKSYLDQAEVIDFDKDYDTEKVRCFLKIKNKWVVLESKSRYEDFDRDYDKSYYEIKAKNYPKKNSDRLVLLPNIIAPYYEWEDTSNSIYIQSFDKDGYQSKPSLDFNGHGWDGWYGTGYFQIDHHQEQLNFKAFVSHNKSGYHPDMLLYTLPDAYKDAVEPIFIQLVSRPFNKRVGAELGLYVLREKINTSHESIKKYEKSGISFGSWQNNQIQYDWKPVFTGFRPSKGDIRYINYFNGAEEDIHKSLGIEVVSAKRAIPSEISFFWKGSEEALEKFHLYLNENIYEWEESGSGILFRFYFDETEMTDIFQRLGRQNQAIQLEVRMQEIDKNSAIFSIQLNNGKDAIPVKRIRFKSVGLSYHYDDDKWTQHFEKGGLKIAFNTALNDVNAVQSFINYSQHIAKESSYVKKYAFQFADHTTKLLIKNMDEGNFIGAKRVLNSYIDNLLPFSGSSIKTADVTSNGLALTLISKDEILSQKVFDKLLGSDFQIQSIENEILLFNLACYYATHNEKEKLLQTTKQALSKGKKSAQFLTDLDFKPYWNDEDFINVLNDSIVRQSNNTTPYDAEFELNLKLSTGQEVRFDTSHKDRYILDESLPIYEFLYPKNITLALSAMKGGSGTALVSRVAIKNLSIFLQSLLESTRLSVDSEQTIPTMNEAFSFGIKRLSKDKVILYNALHTTDHPSGIYDHSYVVDHQRYTQEVQSLITFYNDLQKGLKDHIDNYLNDPLYTHEVDGLSIAFLSKRLLHADKGQHFQIVLKNVTDKPLYFVDNISINSDQFGSRIDINIINRLELKHADRAPLELKPNESITLQTSSKISFANKINLNLFMMNTSLSMVNKGQSERLNNLAEETFSHTWQGQISSDIAVFTLAETWQKDVGTKQEFDDWIAKFSPDIIE